MDNLVVGSVRCFASGDDDRGGGGVTLLVDGSRNALIGAALFAILPLACLVLGGGFCLASLPDTLGALVLVTLVGLAVVTPAFVVLPTIKRLLATALGRVTLDADAAQLRLLAFGVGPPVCRTWRRDELRDVLVHARGAGIYELHILLVGDRFVPLLYGVTRDELEFIARELLRALRVDARQQTVAGWWGDAKADDAADVKVGGVLDYAPEPKEHAAAQRSPFRARVFIPPPGVAAVARQRKWSLITTGVVLIVLLVLQQLVAFQPSAMMLFAYAGVVIVTELPAFIECVRQRTVEVDGERVTLTVRTPLLGEHVRTWPADVVADIAASGATLGLHLRDGTRVALAVRPAPADAADLARSLRPPPAGG